MTPLRVFTAITEIRENIPSDLIALTSLLAEHGWQLKITTETRVDSGLRARVSAARNDWVGMPVTGYEVGYLTSDLQEKTIIQDVRKLTELCLQLEETFSETFPEDRVGRDGYIYEDAGRQLASAGGKMSMLLHIQKQHRAFSPGNERLIYFRFGFMNLVWDAQEVILQQADVEKLESFVHAKRHRQ